MAKSNEHTDTLNDIRRMIARHRWRFFVPCFIVMLAVLVGALFLPRKYEARATFERRNDLVMSEIAGRGAPQSFTRLKRSLIEELGGLPAVDQVVSDLGLAEGAATSDGREIARHDLVQEIHRNVRVSFDMSTPDTDRIRVIYVDEDPEQARDVANQLVRNYMDRARQQVDQMLGQAATFFDGQVEDARRKIDQLEDKKLQFEIDHAGLLPDDSLNSQASLTAAEERLLVAQQRMQTAEKQLRQIEVELGKLDGDEPATIVTGRNPQIDVLVSQRRQFEKRLEEAMVIRKMTEKHPNVIALRQKIEEIDARIAETPEEIVTEKIFERNPKLTELEMAKLHAQSEYDAAVEQVKVSRKQVATLRAQTAKYFPVRAEYRRIERSIEDAQRQLAFWEDNLRRVEMALTAELGQRGITMDFLKPAGAIQRPSSPDLLQVLFAAITLGGAAGVGMVLLADRADQTFHRVEQATRDLPAPVLGAVTEIMTSAQMRWRRFVQRFVQPAAVAVMIATIAAVAYLNYVTLRAPYLLQDTAAAARNDTTDDSAEPMLSLR